MAGLPSVEETRGASAGQIAVRGLAWILATSGGVKLLTAGGQLVLAGLLAPHDFGLVALAYSVTGFTTILQRNGLREILVQRGANFSLYAVTAFWMSLATGCAVAVLTIIAAPFGARIYHAPQVAGLLVVLAVSAPLLALQSVPGAKLQNDLRFRGISVINLCEALGTTGLMLCFAFLGFGAYSIVLPSPIVQALSLVAQLRMTGFKPRAAIDWRIARELIRDSSLILGAAALYVFNMQGVSIVLGLFHTVAIVGVYFFAANLVAQIAGFATNNLWTVLLPSFSSMQNQPARQLAVFVKTATAVNLVVMPICLTLAAMGEPALRLLYGQRWIAAVPVLQILSIGMCFSTTMTLGINLMTAQGRYRELLRLNAHRAIVFLLLIIAASIAGGVLAVAAASAFFSIIYGPLTTRLATRQLGGTWRHVFDVHVGAFAVAAIACGSAWALAHFIAPIRSVPFVELIAIGLLSAGLTLILARFIVPSAFAELVVRLKSLPSRRGPRVPAPQSFL